MAALKFINLLAISSLAVLACSFGATPVTALATEKHFIRDTPAHGHGAIAKRKRAASNNSKRCKQRPSSTAPKPTPKPTPKSSLDKGKSDGDGEGNGKGNDNDKGNGNGKSEPTSTTHSSAKPASTPSSSGSSGSSSGSGLQGKIGLAWPNGPSQSLTPFVTKNVGWVYNWEPSLPPQVKSLGLRGMPMLWGDNQVDTFKKLVKKGYATAVMGPNEPNEKGQSNMSPEHGAQLWKQYIQPLSNEGYTMLVSPATSSNPNGLTWVKDWFKACDGGCNPTHIAVHYYDTKPQGFIDYMTLWHNTFKKPILATEFACQSFTNAPQCNENEVRDFATETLNFAKKTPWLEGIFPFGAMKDMQGVNPLNQLMTSSNKPTALGELYLNA